MKKNLLKKDRGSLRNLRPWLAVGFLFLFHQGSWAGPYLAPSSGLPQDFNLGVYSEALLDAGKLWESNSLHKPFSVHLSPTQANRFPYSQIHYYEDRLSDVIGRASDETAVFHVEGFIGAAAVQPGGPDRLYSTAASQSFLWLQGRFGEHWYARSYLRATSEEVSLPHYTGIPRGIRRGSFNSSEVDQAVIGYDSRYFSVEYGRGRDVIGPFQEENLVISQTAPSYDRLMIDLRYKRFRFRYFYGYLDNVLSDEDSPDGTMENYLRYINGRSIEYTHPGNRLHLGFSEIIVFSGVNYPLDFSYLNPLAFQLEVDLNRRGDSSKNTSNAIWTSYMDWRPINSLRLSSALSVDEFQLDAGDRDQGRPNVIAYQTRVAWTPIDRPDIAVTLYLEGYRSATYMTRHERGTNNFVTRDEPLGHPLGNDADKYNSGLRIILPAFKTLMTIETGKERWGDWSILEHPYESNEDFIDAPFPRGEVRENLFIDYLLIWQAHPRFSVRCDGRHLLDHVGTGSERERFQIGMLYLFPLSFTDRNP